MATRSRGRPWRGVPFVVLAFAAACTDGPVSPGLNPEPVPVAALQCRVDVQSEAMSCALAEPATRLGSATRIIGGQDRYVKLANFDNSYNAGTEIFQTYVTVQNLLAAALGTSDGGTVTGVRIFFYSGPTTPVTVANPDGVAFFTANDQPFFLYNEILTTYEVSVARPWQFNVPAGVATFSFMVYVAADQVKESDPLLDGVWDGSASNDWAQPANWENSVVPGVSNAVQVPSSSSLSGAHMPVLGATASVGSLRVGSGSSLSLGGYPLTVAGNVDATGAIGTGTLVMSGTGALLNGTVPSVSITGSTALQGPVYASGAVSVTGSLTVAGSPLSIQLP